MALESAFQIPVSVASRVTELPTSSRRGHRVTHDSMAQLPPPAVAGGNDLPGEEANRADERQRLTAAVDELNDYVQRIQRDLQFSIDNGSGRTVIKVVDSESKALIRQIPAEEVLGLARQLSELEGGIILQVRV